MGSPQGGARLLDPRWHWVSQAARRLYAELDADAELITLALTITTGAGEVMFYSTDVAGGPVARRVFTDLDALAERAGECTVDVSPEDVTG